LYCFLDYKNKKYLFIGGGLMKRLFYAIGIVVCVLALSSLAEADFTYTGGISLTGSPDGFLQGTGSWNDTGPTTLNWTVTWDGISQYVNYSYTFSVTQHDVSFFILETSDGFSASNITNVTGTFGNYQIGTFDAGVSPYFTMPGDVYGIKFDNVPSGTTTFTVSFDSTQLPEWGDFYARCGWRQEHADGTSAWNSAWNSGFASGETSGSGNDPVSGASSGSVQNHILVPNTLAVVPEPVSSTLFIIGGVFFAGRRLMKKRK